MVVLWLVSRAVCQLNGGDEELTRELTETGGQARLLALFWGELKHLVEIAIFALFFQ